MEIPLSTTVHNGLRQAEPASLSSARSISSEAVSVAYRTITAL
jgi:hypothetical protein